MRKIIKILTLMGFCITLFGCNTSSKGNNIEEPWPSEVVYDNLNTQESKTFLKEILTHANISERRQNVLFEHIDQINNLMSSEELSKGFESYPISETRYDPYELQDKWSNEYPTFIGYDCRITAYSLFSDFLEIPDNLEIKDDFILFDKNALETDRSAILHEQDLNNFLAFYSFIPTPKTNEINLFVNSINDALADKKIKFIENEHASLVSVVFYDEIDDNRLFVGHAGVLFEFNDKIYFLEKIAFQEPYQLCVFDNRSQLSDYLMVKYDKTTSEKEIPPFVLENNHLIEGYRRIKH